MSNRLFSKCWSLVLILMAAGCDSSEKLPLTGNVSLQFVRMSPFGIHFRLTNESSETVSFRGSNDQFAGASPWDVSMACRSPGAEIWDEGPFALVDGGPHTVEVSPGEQVHLVVGNEFAALDEPMEKYNGGRCHLSVLLVGGSFIKSNEFEP